MSARAWRARRAGQFSAEAKADRRSAKLRCRSAQCAAFKHTCPGCGNDLHGDNLCMVSACQWEGCTDSA